MYVVLIGFFRSTNNIWCVIWGTFSGSGVSSEHSQTKEAHLQNSILFQRVNYDNNEIIHNLTSHVQVLIEAFI